MKFEIAVKWIVLGFIMIGIGLSIINVLHLRSLWLDEAMLALNIINKPVVELLKPLNFNQVAPIGFLKIEKIFTILFGNTEKFGFVDNGYALRYAKCAPGGMRTRGRAY